MHKPLVSVCVPTYNGGAYLEQTLRSIAAQTFQDYEVIIIDDHSTDDSVDLAREYAASDPRVRVLEPAERAGSSALNANRCIACARGEWIKFIFQDDLMAPECLTSFLGATRERHRFALSWHDYRFEPGVDEQTRTFYETLPTLRAVFPGTYAPPHVFCEGVFRNWIRNFLGPTSSSFIHRDCFARYGPFSGEIVTFPDLECWIRIGSNEGVAIATAQLVTFRVHGKSISARLRSNSANTYRYLLERVLVSQNLASAPEYESMRQYLRTYADGVSAEEMLIREAKGTRWLAVDAKHRSSDPSLLDQWQRFADSHPQVTAALLKSDWNEKSPFAKLKALLLGI